MRGQLVLAVGQIRGREAVLRSFGERHLEDSSLFLPPACTGMSSLTFEIPCLAIHLLTKKKNVFSFFFPELIILSSNHGSGQKTRLFSSLLLSPLPFSSLPPFFSFPFRVVSNRKEGFP